MRPTKNRVYCYGCQRSKMLFESKAKADNFIAYNSEGIMEENGKAPVRSYYCELCGGYHVTSNPSVEAGEKLNQRDQIMLARFDNYKKGKEDYMEIHLEVIAKTDLAKRQMFFGNFQAIDQLYEEFEIDHDILMRIPLKTRAKYMQLHQRVDILHDVASQMKELLELSKDEMLERIVFENPSKRENTLASIVKGYLLIQDYNEGIGNIEQLVEEEKWTDARSELISLRTYLSEQKATSMLKDIVGRFQGELNKMEKAIADKKKNLKGITPDSEAVAEEDMKTPQREADYKASILSVIERIEKVKQAFEQNDLDTCENELEIAEFLMDDFSFEDDNTKLLRSQIEMWKKKIAEGND